MRPSRAEEHRRAVGEAQVAEGSGGLRRRAARARWSGSAIGENVGSALHLGHVEAAAGGEDRKHRAMQVSWRRVVVSAFSRRRAPGVFRPTSAAAQDAVLVSEGKRTTSIARVDVGDETGGGSASLDHPRNAPMSRSRVGLDLSAQGPRRVTAGVALAPIAFGVAAAIDISRS